MEIVNKHRKDHFDEKSVETDDFLTTAQMFQQKKAREDHSPNRTNHKKKTQFSHYYNAYHSNGVFFNPPSTAV